MKLSVANAALTLVPTVLAILLVGCASPRTVRLDVQTECVPSKNISVGNIRAYATDGKTLVTGSVYPRTMIGVHHAPPGHIDITVLDPDDSPLMHAKTTYSPSPINHRPRGGLERSRFTARIPYSPEILSLISVTHHPIDISECSSVGL
jgi:hypothetical protein